MLKISGFKFGMLTAICQVYVDNALKWRCACECGQETHVLTAKLLNGHTKSCGCLRNKKTNTQE